MQGEIRPGRSQQETKGKELRAAEDWEKIKEHSGGGAASSICIKENEADRNRWLEGG